METITLKAGLLELPYCQKLYKHLLKSAKKIDHWKSQWNVQSLTDKEHKAYINARAINGLISEMAIYTELIKADVQFHHNQKFYFRKGRNILEKDMDFTLLPAGLNIDVKAYLTKSVLQTAYQNVTFDTFKPPVPLELQYHMNVYAVPQLNAPYLRSKNGLALVDNPKELFKEEIKVNILGIATLLDIERWGYLDVTKLTPFSKFIFNYKKYY
jgi:hypothetical protein